MSNSDFVSIVIPTYNRVKYLKQALESVRQQTVQNYEVIVVDDASIDGTPQKIQKMDVPNLQVIEHEANRGGSAARNTGINHAQGDYIAFLDSDDRWRSDKLERQLKRFDDKSIGLVYTGVRLENENKTKESGVMPTKRGDVYQDQLERDWLGPTSTWIVRRECFETAGDFNTKLSARQDYDMSIRISEYYNVDFVPGQLVTLGTEADNRLTEDVEERIESHVYIIEQVVRPRIEQFSTEVRKGILATQYFTLGRYCQRYGHYREAEKYLGKSLNQMGWSPKTLLTYGLAKYDRDLCKAYYKIMDTFRVLRSKFNNSFLR